MSTTVNVYSEFDGPMQVRVGSPGTCIWIRSDDCMTAISLTLDADDRQKIRAALDEIDAREAAAAAQRAAGSGMSAVLTAPFGDSEAIRAAQAANAAFHRAKDFGYSRRAALEFANEARREVSTLETPQHVAQRIVQPMSGRFAGPTGDDAE